MRCAYDKACGLDLKTSPTESEASDAEVSYRDVPDGDRDGQKIRSIISVNINIHIC